MSVNLPDQVRRQVEAAEAKLAESQPTDAQDQSQTSSPTDSAQANQVDIQPESTPTEDQTTEDFEQKWRSLQGIYNSELRKGRAIQAQLQAAANRISQLESIIATLNTSSAPAAPQAQSASLVTDKDMQEFGAETIDLVRRVARDVVAQGLNEVRGQVAPTINSLAQQVHNVAASQTATAEEMFYSRLATILPNWRTVNVDKGFQDWLLHVDPMTGIQRQTYLDDAHRRLDVARVASIFKTWIAGNNRPDVTSVPAQSTPAPTPAQQLQRQVAPGHNRSGGNIMQSQPKSFTRDEIAKYYDGLRRGEFKGKEAEWKKIEEDIFAAAREGRVAA